MYEKVFEIPYFQCDNKGYLKAEYLLKYLGEISNLHGDDLGLSYEYFREKNMAWILNRWKLNINILPSFKEKVKIRTWIIDFNRFYAYRKYELVRESGEVIVDACSVWLLVDLKRKRPIKISDELADKYKIKGGEIPKFYEFKDPVLINDTLIFNVRKSDIDYNLHVNNSIYLNWILESISLDYEENNRIKELEILYKKETLYGEQVYSKKGLVVENNLENEFMHEIVGREGQEIKALARSIWI